MAMKTADREREDLAAFVNALMSRADYATAAAFARDAGFTESRLSQVRRGQAGIDGINLLRLIRAAAARMHMTPEELALGISGDHLHGLVERLEAAVALLESRPAAQPDQLGLQVK